MRIRALEKGEELFSRYGAAGVLLGPVWLAGINRMPWRTFMLWKRRGGGRLDPRRRSRRLPDRTGDHGRPEERRLAAAVAGVAAVVVILFVRRRRSQEPLTRMDDVARNAPCSFSVARNVGPRGAMRSADQQGTLIATTPAAAPGAAAAGADSSLPDASSVARLWLAIWLVVAVAIVLVWNGIGSTQSPFDPSKNETANFALFAGFYVGAPRSSSGCSSSSLR